MFEEIDFAEFEKMVEGSEEAQTEMNVEDIVLEDDTKEEVENVKDEKVEPTEDTKTEATKEDEEVKTETTITISEPTVETESYKTLKSLINLGEIEDFSVVIDDKSILLSEYKDIDEDTLKDVLKTYREEEAKNFKTDYISVKDLDETKKALIEIVKKGSYEEVQELFKNPTILKDPFEGFDNSNVNHNSQVYMAHLTQVKGHAADEAKALLDIAIKNNTVDEKALKIVEDYREQNKKAILEEQKRIEEQEKEKKERIKTYSKDLDEVFKSYELRPEKILEYKKLATQFDKVGNLPIDSMYEDLMKDPKKAADLILFITDRELYDKRVKASAKRESDINTARQIRIIRDTKKTNNVENKTEPEKIENIFEGLIIED